MILDTSFLLDLKDGDEAAFEKAVELYDAEVPQRVSVVSVMELSYGVAFTGSDEERRRVENLLMLYPLEDVNESIGRAAGELLGEADRDAGGDSGVDNEDGLIGALADRLDEPVVTANADHFERLGVDVERYRRSDGQSTAD